jgi:hypothetical protein
VNNPANPGGSPSDGRIRDAAGQFKKGQSGNPAGKPPGTRNKVAVWAEGIIQDNAEKALNALMEKVAEGDMVAIKMVIDRISPIRKPAPFAMPEHLSDKAEMMKVIMAAVADGDLTPGEALDVSKLATILARAMGRPSAEIDVRKLAAAISRAKEKTDG